MPGRTPERWLVQDLSSDARAHPAAVNLKLAKLARDPFAFFRGTLPEYVRWVRPELVGGLAQTIGLVTGDLHLENFGAYRGESGDICFDLNDFDEATRGPLVIDVRRLAASAGLASIVAGDSARTAGATLEAVLRGVTEPQDEPPECVRELMAKSRGQRPEALLAESVIASAGPPRLRTSEANSSLHLPARHELERAVGHLQGGSLRFIDAAGRLAGNGSLGRRRYLVLAQAGRTLALLDFKEPRGSPWGDVPCLLGARRRGHQVERVARALRGESEDHLGTVRVGARLFQVKEHSANGLKLSAARLSSPARQAYASFTGALLVRAWARARLPSKEMIEQLQGRGRARLLSQARTDIERTLEGYHSFMSARERIESRLRLSSQAA